MGVFDSLRAVAGAAVSRVTIRANVLPVPIVLDAPLGPSAPDDGAASAPAPSLLGRLLKPSIELETAFGPATLQPYGAPDDATAALVFGGLVVAGLAVLGLAGFGLFTLAKGK